MTEADWIAFFSRSEIPAFNARMLVDPDADLPRLVFADWVEENCSSTAFAAALRRSIAQPERPVWCPNFSTVVRGHELRIWRGRLEVGIYFDDPDFDPYGDEFVREAMASGWVGRLKIRGFQPGPPPGCLADRRGAVEGIEWLDLFNSGITWSALLVSIGDWQLPRLKCIDLRSNRLGEEEIRAITGIRSFAELTLTTLLLDTGGLSETSRWLLANFRSLPEHIREQFRPPA